MGNESPTLAVRARDWIEAGLTVGLETAEHVLHVRERLVPYLVENAGCGEEGEMLELARAYLAEVEAADPDAYGWISGLAIGAGLDATDVALVAFSEEIAARGGRPMSKCSTFAARALGGEPLIGHNEDYEPHYLGRMIALDMKVGEGPRVVSLNYPGQLPHGAGAMNACGVCVTNNSLWPSAQPRLSNQVKLFRAARAEGAEAAIAALVDPPGSLTSHYVVAEARGVWSVEVSNPEIAHGNESVVSVGEPAFVHTNHVLRLPLRAPDPAVEANNHTLARYAKLEARLRHRAPTTLEEALQLLSENDGLIHRVEAQCPTSVTLATLAIAPFRKEIRIRRYGADGSVKDEAFAL